MQNFHGYSIDELHNIATELNNTIPFLEEDYEIEIDPSDDPFDFGEMLLDLIDDKIPEDREDDLTSFQKESIFKFYSTCTQDSTDSGDFSNSDDLEDVEEDDIEISDIDTSLPTNNERGSKNEHGHRIGTIGARMDSLLFSDGITMRDLTNTLSVEFNKTPDKISSRVASVLREYSQQKDKYIVHIVMGDTKQDDIVSVEKRF